MSQLLHFATCAVALAADTSDKTIEEEVHGAYIRAINSIDVGTLLADLTDDIVYQSPGEPEIIGKAAVRKWSSDYLGSARTHWEKTSIGFVVSGDWALERYTRTLKAGSHDRPRQRHQHLPARQRSPVARGNRRLVF